MHYVYFLKSKNKSFHYIGITANLSRRLSEHNADLSQSTKHYAPFELISYIGVRSIRQAEALEKYFKSGYGFAVAKKRLFEE